MHAITRAALLAIAAAASPVLLDGAHAQGAANPACGLLSTEEINAASGQNYDAGDEGDALGEGVAGGASCQWGGASFAPGKSSPMLSIIYIPGGKRYAETHGRAKAREGCTREMLSGVGSVAFVETCAKGRGPVAYINVGATDLLVQMDAREPLTPASAKAATVAVAKAAAAKVR